MVYLLLAFTVTLLVLVVLLKTRLINIALDAPNHRSLHTKVTPRTGGLAIMLGVICTWLSLSVNSFWLLFPMVLMVISLIDDVYNLSVKWRLLAQLLVSLAFVLILLSSVSLWLIVPLVLVITWMTNLYNFMDGSDGLAGGMGLFGFTAYGIAAGMMGDMNLAMMNGAIASACFAFLLFNFYPAKIFMGDVGSIPLGFLAGAIGVYGFFQSLWPIWFPALVFSPFIVDATVTLIKRKIAGERIGEAHRSHYYQRLVQMGWGHKTTAIAEYILMFAVVFTSVFMLKISLAWQIILLIIWTAIYVVFMVKIDQKWNKQVTS